MRGNATRNQHFLPRVEQKLNALNPGSISGKFRIYSFLMVNRQTYEIALENPRGHSIDAALSMLDLFSFDVLVHRFHETAPIRSDDYQNRLAASDFPP